MQVCKGRDAGWDAGSHGREVGRDAGLHRLPGCSEDAAFGRQARRAGGDKADEGAAEVRDSQVRAEHRLSCQGSGPAADFGRAGSLAQEGLGSILPPRCSLGKRQLLGLACKASQRKG